MEVLALTSSLSTSEKAFKAQSNPLISARHGPSITTAKFLVENNKHTLVANSGLSGLLLEMRELEFLPWFRQT